MAWERVQAITRALVKPGVANKRGGDVVSNDELATLARWHFEAAYRSSARREKCSRADFRSGWDAAWQVIGQRLAGADRRELQDDRNEASA
jgi:hypothetical protein